MERRDEAEEVEQSCSAGAAEFPGIVEPDSFGSPEHQTGKWQAASLTGVASAQTRRWASRGQGLKILAREAKNIAARLVPKSRTEWSWDCKTPDSALTGISVSVRRACVFARTSNRPFFFRFPVTVGRHSCPSHIRISRAAGMATHERAGRALI